MLQKLTYGTVVRVQPSQNTIGLCHVWQITRLDSPRSGWWVAPDQDQGLRVGSNLNRGLVPQNLC